MTNLEIFLIALCGGLITYIVLNHIKQRRITKKLFAIVQEIRKILAVK